MPWSMPLLVRRRARSRSALAAVRTTYIIEVSDDGVGLPQERPASTGLEIVETLVRDDLRGKIAFKSGKRGTQVIIRLSQSIAEIT